MQNETESSTLSGVPPAQTWVKRHGRKRGFSIEMRTDLDSKFRAGGPVLFRDRNLGPYALALVERVSDVPLPKTKFFHSTPVGRAQPLWAARRTLPTGSRAAGFLRQRPRSVRTRRCGTPTRG